MTSTLKPLFFGSKNSINNDEICLSCTDWVSIFIIRSTAGAFTDEGGGLFLSYINGPDNNNLRDVIVTKLKRFETQKKETINIHLIYTQNVLFFSATGNITLLFMLIFSAQFCHPKEKNIYFCAIKTRVFQKTLPLKMDPRKKVAPKHMFRPPLCVAYQLRINEAVKRPPTRSGWTRLVFWW